jgi:hypothetical protein
LLPPNTVILTFPIPFVARPPIHSHASQQQISVAAVVIGARPAMVMSVAHDVRAAAEPLHDEE